MSTKSAARLGWLAVVLPSLLLGGACGGGGGADDVPTPPDGGAPDAVVETWAFADVNGVPNLDDDDGAMVDWDQPPFAADDDFSTFVLPATTLALVPTGGDVQLSFATDTTNVRVFRDGQHVLGGTAGNGPLVITPTGADLTFAVEFGAYAAAAPLEVSARAAGGAVAHTTTVTLQAAPLIMNHHLQPAEHVWAVAVNGNASMIADFTAALGTSFTAVPGSSYGGDIWIQDEIEFATLTGSAGQRLDVVIDSIRNRGLDSFPERTLVGPDVIASTWGTASQRTTYDSFGNLEASPPVTVGGVEYPFGRIYYGRTENIGLHAMLAAFLASQKVQAPFELPTRWLCVGHVDEFSSFLPDPSSPKGFKLVVADVPSAWALLQTLPRESSLARFGADHGYPTVGALLDDVALRALNDDLQTDYLEPIIAKFKTELGLTDADIIRAPSLFETVGGCSGRVAALIPGMVNLIVAKVDQTTHVFTADPFFRATGAPQASDPVITAFSQRMPAGLELHFVDDWNVYHLGLGEVHCGTNVKRTPAASWWSAAKHLLGGN